MQAAESFININLLPLEEHAIKRRFAPSRYVVIAMFATAGVFTLISVLAFVQGLRVKSLRSEIDALHIAARESRVLIQRINTLTAEREEVRNRLAVIGQLDEDRFVRVRLADELSRRVPDQVWVTEFAESQGHVLITGVTFSNLSVAEFISNLERSVLYEKVDLTVSRRGLVDANEVVNFTITAKCQKGPQTRLDDSPAG